MKRGRKNVQLPDGMIKKFNVYQDEYDHQSNYYIYYQNDYHKIKRCERYKGGWLWRLDISC